MMFLPLFFDEGDFIKFVNEDKETLVLFEIKEIDGNNKEILVEHTSEDGEAYDTEKATYEKLVKISMKSDKVVVSDRLSSINKAHKAGEFSG